jgi:NADPH-dependent 7-cyano-7-deazaguanine reductase QueF
MVYELQEAQFPSTPRPTYGRFAARMATVLVVPITPRNFSALCEVTGLPDCAAIPASQPSHTQCELATP